MSFPSGKEERELYVEALKREIAEGIYAEGDSLCSDNGRGKGKDNWQVTSIFFGGGTPSVLEGKELAGILNTVNQVFEVDKDAEITMEANPGTLTPEKLDMCRRAGFNRISLGLQSSHNTELKNLGRIHTWEDFQESFQMAKKAGFYNINVDLMSALPGQTRESWSDTLHKACELKPGHISAYSLIIEEGTPFYNMYAEDVRLREQGKECRLLPSEGEERRMYEDTQRILRAAGYNRYEISNYAMPGYECRHNIAYWRRQDYIGFGLGAASLINECRFSNTRQLQAYMAADGITGYGITGYGITGDGVSGYGLKESIEPLDIRARMEEFMFLGLRMCEGISISEFERQFRAEFNDVYGEITEKLINDGLLNKRDNNSGDKRDDKRDYKRDYKSDGWISLTERGTDLSNYVMAQYLLD